MYKEQYYQLFFYKINGSGISSSYPSLTFINPYRQPKSLKIKLTLFLLQNIFHDDFKIENFNKKCRLN